jgi:hypothetical protein
MKLRNVVKGTPPLAALLTLIVLGYADPTHAQNPKIRYATNFATEGASQPSAIVADPEGDAFVTGQTCVDSACTNQEALTIKYDPTGKLLWKASLKSPIGVANSLDIGVDSAGNSYVLFLLWQKRNSSNQPSDPDVVTAKYNSAGVRQWINFISSTSAVTRTPVKLVVSPAGNVYVLMSAAPVSGSAAEDVLILKYDTNGETSWTQVAPRTSNTSNIPVGIQLDAHENVCVLTHHASSGGDEIASEILRYSSAGALLNSFGAAQFADALAFQVSPSGDSYVAGVAPASTAGSSANTILAKFSSDGTLLWSDSLGAAAGSSPAPKPTALALDPAEDVFLASTETNRLAGCGTSLATGSVITKFDATGHQNWSSTFLNQGQQNTPVSAVANSIGEIYVLVANQSASGSSCQSLTRVLKLGLTGNTLFDQLYDHQNSSNVPAGIAIGGQGGLFVAEAALLPGATATGWATVDFVQDGGSFNFQQINFGDVLFPFGAADQIVTLTNSGEIELTNIKLVVSPTYTFAFGANNCPAQLAPGASCQFDVEVIDNGEGSDGTVTLQDNWTGNAINRPTIQLMVHFVPNPEQ